jgi:hypothetical protein
MIDSALRPKIKKSVAAVVFFERQWLVCPAFDHHITFLVGR